MGLGFAWKGCGERMIGNVHCASRLASILVLSAALLAAGCSLLSPPKVAHGNNVDTEDLHELIPGISTRADVTALLGSPSAKVSFDDNEWLYISEVVQSRIAQTPAVRNQQVVLVRFDDKGVLREIRRLGPEDAKPLQMTSRTTPTPGEHAGIFQQIIGNVGAFNPFGGYGGMNQNTSGVGPPTMAP
jgi:outer membrane protein assembly factor BamE (lipoprotein component of BamABCDE complex)